MAKVQAKKAQAQVSVSVQTGSTVFALDIGTRSIIGMVGSIEEDRVKIIAIEREEHTERAMIDGQIENIEKVALLADRIKKRLEHKINIKLNRVCVAAAGRALRTKRAEYELDLSGVQLIDDEVISRLEAGAISKAEEAFDAENDAPDNAKRFYLVGYTVCQYFLDQYMISNLKDHRGQHVRVDLIATFLPSEVVESLYTTMNKIGLEVASLTLEPIAAINAAIPENLRLLNLALVDIGAGTSDIAACTGGSVTGYTMATVAGDEITETIMKEYLVDFKTAELIKAKIEHEDKIVFADILGLEHTLSREDILRCIQKTSALLCKEIAAKILEVNGGPPSALFLAGGGSKLAGLKDGLTAALKMDANRVAIAGNYFQANAYSEEYDLNNPEYATPLGIAISSGLNLINDSFRVVLNDRPAKLFRSGSFTALNLLMMNGYGFRDIMGRPGLNLTVTVNGMRKVFYGTSAQPASLFINKQEGKLSEIIHAGDFIDFIPAVQGIPASACLGDIEGAADCIDITLNGEHVPLSTPLKNGDSISIKRPPEPAKTEQAPTESEKEMAQEQVTDSVFGSEETSGPLSPSDSTVQKPDMSEPGILEPASQQTPPSASETGTSSTGQPGRIPPVRTRSWQAQEAAPASMTATQQTTEHTPASDTADGLTQGVVSSSGVAGRVAQGMASVSDVIGRQAQGAASASGVSGRMAQENMSALASAAGQPVEPSVIPPETSIPKKDIPPRELLFHLNGSSLRLPAKHDNSPYYLMDMIQYSGIDLKHPKGKVRLTVNGASGMFQQVLSEGDIIYIEEEIE